MSDSSANYYLPQKAYFSYATAEGLRPLAIGQMTVFFAHPEKI
jgi:hypothetical protein